MDRSFSTGFSFGLTSGVITTLGLMIGLYSSTQSKVAVIGAILTIAITDALSDAVGIHVSEESIRSFSNRQIWRSTFATFLFKLVFALVFIAPVLLLPLNEAMLASIILGIVLLGILSYLVAKKEKANPVHVVSEHLLIMTIVIIASRLIGNWIAYTFHP